MSYLFISLSQFLVSAHCPGAWDTQVVKYRQFLPSQDFHSSAGDSPSNGRHMNKGTQVLGQWGLGVGVCVHLGGDGQALKEVRNLAVSLEGEHSRQTDW